MRHSQYDERWRAVREAGLSAECAHAILGNLGKPDSANALAAFNRTVNGRIRYADDSKAGQADSWAPASQTLASGAGDCEDFAILKLQLLLALGVAEQDVYLTLVRDTVRKRDHAVVVVRSSGRATLLDSVSDLPIDADADTGYRPVIAFSGAQTWLLGTQRAGIIVPSSPR